jgi:two-component system KDP operon response regulator KdpE
MGLLTRRNSQQSELPNKGTQMSRKWSLRQLIVKTCYKAPERDTAEASASQTGIIESGDCKIDLAERTVTLHGQELQLTSEEFDVLVFLAGHPQRLVTQRTMLRTSWAANRLEQTDFLKTLISLRKKLDAAGPGQHYLRTEPWVIYRFDPTSSSAA